ncbi:hypothetical protein DFJ74DRAFT_705839 [Hyaloraphidium curvatum]|nr:hypothetical protein DFJ74DRAFT_705839 [Hyaloraphidium curvatum]
MALATPPRRGPPPHASHGHFSAGPSPLRPAPRPGDRGLPYEPEARHWILNHTQNLEGLYCYCGGDRNLNEVNLQCRKCRNWFHASCLSAPVRAEGLITFMMDYNFTCALCVRAEKGMADDEGDWPGEERFERTAGSWEESVVTAIACLALKKMQDAKRSMHDATIPGDDPTYYFKKNEHICPFIDKNWRSLCRNRERSANAWVVVGSCLYSNTSLFAPFDEKSRSASSPFTLCEKNLYNLRPGLIQELQSSNKAVELQDAPSEPTRTKKTADKKRRLERDVDEAAAADLEAMALFEPAAAGDRSRSLKTVEETQRAFIPPDNWDVEHPWNKDGYKYEFGESNPAGVFRDTHFRPQQYFRSRAGGSPVFLSPTDRSAQIEVLNDGVTATNKAGFRSVRSNVGVKEGNWYFEVHVLKGGSEGRTDNEGRTGANVRLGWSRREATLGAPIGYDSYGYGYRDSTGEKLHESQPVKYADAFGSGDVIGCFISLPPMAGNVVPREPAPKEENDGEGTGSDERPQLIHDLSKMPPESVSMFKSKRHRPAIRFRGGLFLESRDYQPINIPPLLTWMMMSNKAATLKSHSTPITQRTLPWYASLLSKDFPTLRGSYITFYKNGVSQGTAFQDIAAPIPAAAAVPEDHRKPLESFLPEPPVADDGTIGYYPTVSLFSGGSVKLNFGPDFAFPPQDLDESGVRWRPMCERLAEREAEECMMDMLDEVSTQASKGFPNFVFRSQPKGKKQKR